MAIKTMRGNIDVVTAARGRICNALNSGRGVSLSVSGGKDSITLQHLVYKEILSGRAKKDKLRVVFIDEEAMFNDVIENVFTWRSKWLNIGVPFHWYCMEFKHFNCLNTLETDETFITWDRYQECKWVRKLPPFSIRYHSKHKPRIDTYQSFLGRVNKGRVSLIGLRADESIQRLKALSRTKGFYNKEARAKSSKVYPIYDWSDRDVWLYIKNNDISFPKTYLYLYMCGLPRRSLRISQFFSADTVKSLAPMSEFDQNLLKRITKREKNAYLPILYHGSGMFRSSRKFGNSEKKKSCYTGAKEEAIKMLGEEYRFKTPASKSTRKAIKGVLYSFSMYMEEKNWRTICDIIIQGDPKNRSVRALYTAISKNKSKKKELQ